MKMKKKKQAFSFLRVAKAMWLFFGIVIVVILLGLLVEGPTGHKMEVEKLEERVKIYCKDQCVSEIKYQPKLLGAREWQERQLEEAKKEKENGDYFSEKTINRTIERLERELDAKTKIYCKDGKCSSLNPCEINQGGCIANKAALSKIKNGWLPSIFYYYGKIIWFILPLLPFFILLILPILIIITFLDVRKLKNKK